jgi:hypothetical protein
MEPRHQIIKALQSMETRRKHMENSALKEGKTINKERHQVT